MKKKIFIFLCLVIIPLSIYLPVINYDLVWDDEENISTNPFFANPSLKNILELWKAPSLGLYVPVTYTLWGLLVKLAGGVNSQLIPKFLHLANVSIHTLSTILLFFILRLLLHNIDKLSRNLNKTGADKAALFGALLFSVHPVQVEAVSWITGLKDILLVFFSFSSLLFYLKYIIRKNLPSINLPHELTSGYIYYILSSFFYLLALLSKPTAIMLPFITLAISSLTMKEPFKKNIRLILPWMIAAIPIILVNRSAQPDSGYGGTLYQRPFIILDTITFYLQKVFFPIGLIADYGRSPATILESGKLYYAWLIPSVFVVVIICRKQNKILISALLIFIFGFLPVSGFLPFDFQRFSTVADRYIYLSMIGPSILVATFFYYERGGFLNGLIISILIVMAIKSAIQIKHWKNNFTLFSHTLAFNDKSYISHNNVGSFLYKKEQISLAENHFRKAILIKPDSDEAHNALGLTLYKAGKNSEAIYYFKKALELKPDQPKLYNNLGLAEFNQGHFDKSISYYKKAIELDKQYGEANYNIGNTLFQIGNYSDAVFYFKEALRLIPNDIDISINLANTYINMGKIQNGIDELKNVIDMDYNNAEAHYNLGVTLMKHGNTNEGKRHISEALRIKPDLL